MSRRLTRDQIARCLLAVAFFFPGVLVGMVLQYLLSRNILTPSDLSGRVERLRDVYRHDPERFDVAYQAMVNEWKDRHLSPED